MNKKGIDKKRKEMLAKVDALSKLEELIEENELIETILLWKDKKHREKTELHFTDLYDDLKVILFKKRVNDLKQKIELDNLNQLGLSEEDKEVFVERILSKYQPATEIINQKIEKFFQATSNNIDNANNLKDLQNQLNDEYIFAPEFKEQVDKILKEYNEKASSLLKSTRQNLSTISSTTEMMSLLSALPEKFNQCISKPLNLQKQYTQVEKWPKDDLEALNYSLTEMKGALQKLMDLRLQVAEDKPFFQIYLINKDGASKKTQRKLNREARSHFLDSDGNVKTDYNCYSRALLNSLDSVSSKVFMLVGSALTLSMLVGAFVINIFDKSGSFNNIADGILHTSGVPFAAGVIGSYVADSKKSKHVKQDFKQCFYENLTERNQSHELYNKKFIDAVKEKCLERLSDKAKEELKGDLRWEMVHQDIIKNEIEKIESQIGKIPVPENEEKTQTETNSKTATKTKADAESAITK